MIDSNDQKFIEKLKHIKTLKKQNREKIEKITNFDLEAKKKLITNIVNLKILKTMIEEEKIYYTDYKLLWVNSNNAMTIDQVIVDLEKQLKQISK